MWAASAIRSYCGPQRSRDAMLVVLLLLGAATAQTTGEQTVLCGRELAKAHSMYCYGIELPAEAVDSNSPSLFTTGPNPASVIQVPARFAFRARRSAEAIQKTAALVEECCQKPCHITDLLNYC